LSLFIYLFIYLWDGSEEAFKIHLIHWDKCVYQKNKGMPVWVIIAFIFSSIRKVVFEIKKRKWRYLVWSFG